MKRTITKALIITTALCIASSLYAFASLKGDVNGNGNIANDDLSTLIQYLSGHISDIDTENSDIDKNDKVNNRDAIAIIQKLAGWENDSDTYSEMPDIEFPTPSDVNTACFYVNSASGSDGALGTSETDAVKTLEQAYSLAEYASGDNARIILTDTYTLTNTFTEPAHEKNITLSACGGKLKLNGNYRYVLSGNTTFENINIEYKSTVNFVANYNYITFGEGVILTKTSSGNGAYVVGGYQSPASNADTSKNSHIRIDSGEFWAVIGGSRQKSTNTGELAFTGYHYIEVNGGKINTVYGGTTSNHSSMDAYIKVTGGEITTLCAAGEITRSLMGNAVIELSGGSIDLVNINNVYGDAVVKQYGADIRSANVSYYNLDIRASATATGGAKVFVYPDGMYSESYIHNLSEKFDAALTHSTYTSETSPSENVIFVSGAGNGTGTSPYDTTTFSNALKTINDSGVIVVTSPVPVNESVSYSHSGRVVITSKYGGVDYSKENDAALVFSSDFSLRGETVLEHIEIQSTASYRSIFCHNNPVTIGEGVICLKTAEGANFMSLMGGSRSAYYDAMSSLSINSGSWQRVRGGTAASGSNKYTVSLTVNGGRFAEVLTLGSSLTHVGDIRATINGGTFFGGIAATGISDDSQYFSSAIELTINGGIFYQSIGVSRSTNGSYDGSFDVTINGGEFAHLVTLTGSDGLSGIMYSSLTSSIDLSKKETGVYNFSNPVQGDGADPWVFYNNGYYYYIATAGSVLRLRRAANIGDLPYAESKIVYDPEDGHMWSKNLWSPEIHYYTDEQIGKGNGGWYCYIACDDGNNTNHRMYVIKCLDGNDLFGRWGNPVTGEVNVPQKVEAKDIPGFDDLWAAGQSAITINGQIYTMYITETGRGTSAFHQTINIVKMTNPWTITGLPHVICRPEYQWEMNGYGTNGTKWWPKVVEGATAVYGDNGEVYIIYSGSGYWTTYYCLAQLKYLGGDPLDINNWEKSPEPIFSKNGQINGCGHASYVTDTSGQRWICYHAYTGTTTDSGRDAFVEPYKVDANGVTVGNGSTHPADYATVYTANLNPMSLFEKTSSFANVN